MHSGGEYNSSAISFTINIEWLNPQAKHTKWHYKADGRALPGSEQMAQGALCMIPRMSGEPGAWEELILASPEREMPEVRQAQDGEIVGENTMQQAVGA